MKSLFLKDELKETRFQRNKRVLNSLETSIEDLYLKGLSSVEITKLTKLDNNFVLRYLRKKAIVRTISESILKYKTDSNLFDIIDTEEKAYWLGFLYADGCIDKRNTIRINLAICDIKHLEKFKIFLKTDKPIYINKAKTNCEISINNNILSKKLQSYGIKVNKVYDKFNWEIIPKELHNHFIRGYFDGDGGINDKKNNKKIEISLVGGESFITDVLNILHENLNISLNKRAFKHCPKIFYFATAGNQKPKTILNYLYKNSNIYLNRKYERFVNYV